MRLHQIRPRIIRLDAGDLGLRLIIWIHMFWSGVADIRLSPQTQKNRSRLPSTWRQVKNSACRSSIERIAGPRLPLFSLAAPLLCGWSALIRQVALT